MTESVRPSTRTPSRSRTPDAHCSFVADTGLVAALPLSLSPGRSGSHDRRSHELDAAGRS
jgi:hypothetical protein